MFLSVVHPKVFTSYPPYYSFSRILHYCQCTEYGEKKKEKDRVGCQSRFVTFAVTQSLSLINVRIVDFVFIAVVFLEKI